MSPTSPRMVSISTRMRHTVLNFFRLQVWIIWSLGRSLYTPVLVHVYCGKSMVYVRVGPVGVAWRYWMKTNV
jgi:hypothetical protein